MKKKMILLLFIGLFIFAGCENKQEKINNKMAEYVTDYYETYIKNYDLVLFEDCTDSSYATLILDDDKNISSIEFHMNCK